MKPKIKKTRLINIKRLFFFPLLITTFITMVVGLFVYYITINQSQKDFLSRGIGLTNAYSLLVQRNHEYENHTLDDFNKRIINAGQLVIDERDELSNAKLCEFTKITEVSYIWWFTPEGEVLFAATEEDIGWKATEGDPIDNFIKSEKEILLEGIRFSVDEEREFLSGFVRAADGYFVQVAIDVNEVIPTLETVAPIHVVKDIVKSNEHVIFASIVDTGGFPIATTKHANRFVEYTDSYDQLINRTLKGEVFGTRVFDEEMNGTILEIFAPIYHEGEIVNILIVGFSLDFYNTYTLNAAFLITAAILVVAIIYTAAVYVSVVVPLESLDKAVLSFNPKTGEYTRPISNYKVFTKLYDSIDIVGKRILETNLINSELNDEVQKLAYTDYLTNTPNRLSLEKVIGIKTKLGKKFALIFIDIDDFKRFNDTKGHNFGDNLLITVTEHLKNLQKEHRYFIYRYGGDEFIILKDYQNECEVDRLAKIIQEHFINGVFIGDDEYTLTLSMGISLYPLHGNNANELIRKADIAMYNVKSNHDHIHTYYQDEMDRVLQEEINISQAIRRAIKKDDFTIVIQPQYYLDSESIVSYEALARLKRGTISPAKFIAVAEKSNLISQIGKIVIKKTFQTLKQLKEKNVKLLPIYVNISAKQLSDPSLIEYIQEMAGLYQVDLQYFGVELTESTIIDNEAIARESLSNLKKLGIKISIDDFGSGQAGLNYLMKYPVEMVKIDRAFCSQYLQDGKVQIFEAIVRLAKLLGFKVLAEGIEEKEQVALLKKTGCEFVQGFYYSRPIEVSQLLK